ncbi:GGDEF domain-containing protein [Pseudonocardia acidicola]|uniref:GGDEF domain-containing protein n=1 Tax=Pseudonocardia acidicola TaxID=2724939 RepID=A0ABX1SAW1_9PSEU|nr:GGDEF domain-containing protein [Pseudonocardia acidicola]NMH98695.1 GGDEF domain-containing protein [Pseudonocardia acidicola]
MMPPSPRSQNWITRWAVWSLPSRLLTAVLSVELLTAGVLVADLFAIHDVDQYLWILGVLAAAGVVHTEVSLGVERIRRRVTETRHIDLSSVWTFAAALLLPPLLASAVVLIIYGHLYFRVLRPAKTPTYRQVFSASTILLAVHAASAVLGYLGRDELFSSNRGFFTIVLALLAYTVINTSLIVGVIVLSSDAKFLHVLGRGDEVMLEVATLSMGALAAGMLLSGNPFHAALVLPPLLVLHRAILVRQLEEQANTDSKTGLLNAAAWHNQAARALRRAQRTAASAAVLIIDLDHFKAINDRHGHLAGDQVLSAIAGALRAEVRDNDLVGRFGGEEFVVLLPGLGLGDRPNGERSELHFVAERIRQRIDHLAVEIPTPDGPLTVNDISVSVGGATFPQDGAELRQLLEVADSALYAAKRAGRNAVRMGSHLDASPPTQRTKSGERRPRRTPRALPDRLD